MAAFDKNRWLAKLTGQVPPDVTPGTPPRGNLILKDTGMPVLPGQIPGQIPGQVRIGGQPKQLTKAAMVYALGAGALFVMAIFNMAAGNIFNGIVVLVPAGCLLVLAYKYLQ